MWSTILIATKYGIDFKTRFCICLLWSSQSYSWSIQAGSVIYSGRKYKHLLWFSTSLPLILGSSISKEISETMDLNEMNKINTGRRCKAFSMKNHYGNENSLKWFQVEACKTFCIVGTATVSTLANDMFDIAVKFLCLLMNVCFRTVPILQHYMACQRASKILSQFNGCF